jgi:DNA modification methylase
MINVRFFKSKTTVKIHFSNLQTSKEFELVLDPFMGSGTVGRVCDEINRDFVGYDLKDY